MWQVKVWPRAVGQVEAPERVALQAQVWPQAVVRERVWQQAEAPDVLQARAELPGAEVVAAPACFQELH